jgi:hypothetical protein
MLIFIYYKTKIEEEIIYGLMKSLNDIVNEKAGDDLLLFSWF